MDFDLLYIFKKIEHLEHPIWHDRKDAVIWILVNFINKNLHNELIYKPISEMKIKLKYIKKYMHCSKEIVYIEELLAKYETEQITTMNNLSILSKQIDRLVNYINDLYIKSLKNNDILYFDDNLNEYIEVLDLETTSKVPILDNNAGFNIDDETIEIINDLEKTFKLAKINPNMLKKLDINDETIEVLKDLEKTLILDGPIKEDIEILDYLDKTTKIPKLTKKELKKLDVNDEAIEVLKDLEKTLILDGPIKEDIEILDYLDKTIKIPKLTKKELKKLDVNDEAIEVLRDLEKTLILDGPIKEDIEILDYLDKTIRIPKLTKKELKKLDVNDETIEVLDFLEKTRKLPKIKEAELSKSDFIKIKALEKTIKVNRYQITESMLKKIEKRKKARKLIFATIFSVLCFIFFVSSYRIIAWYRSNLDLKEEIQEITSTIDVKEFDDNNDVVNNTTDTYLSETFIDVDFDELLKINQDSIGWIYVPGTNIDYPFVQTKDNKYYLTHSFSKSYNDAGWVFMDYRNKTDVLDFNTIIYAHGRLDKTMFGSLRNTLEKEWYNNEDNHYIKIAMPSNNTLWQVFSVYKIETETYYLQNNFSNYENHKKFIETLEKRSIYDFNVEVTTSDKILTLSTCYDNFSKVVVHAKMIKQYNK